MRWVVGMVLLGGALATGWMTLHGHVGRTWWGEVAAEPALGDQLAAAWRGVAEAPGDASAWMKLAELQQALDQLPVAERSLEHAIELGDPFGRARGALGFLLYGQGRDEEALVLLEEAANQGADLPLLQPTLRLLREGARPEPQASQVPPPSAPTGASDSPRWQPDAGVVTEPQPDASVFVDPEPELEPAELPSTPEPGGRRLGPCEVPLERRARENSFRLTVTVAGLSAELIVDTGASLTVITRELAEDLGVPLDRRRMVRAITANGRVDMPTAVLAWIDVAGYEVENLRVAVCEGCVEGVADGLLGLDIQTLLKMRIDPAAGIADFADCN